MIELLARLIIGGLILYFIITSAIKVGVKEALSELKKEGFFDNNNR